MNMEETLNSLTLGDMEELEDYTGKPFLQLADDFETGNVPTKVFIFMTYLANRRNNPDYTLEEARKVPLGEMIGTFQPVGE